MDLRRCFFCKARTHNILSSNSRLREQMCPWKYVMVKDNEEKIRVLTKPLQTRGEKKLSAVQFSNTTGKRAARLRLLEIVSTVTVAHDEQQRIWKICMSSPTASMCWCSTGKTPLKYLQRAQGKWALWRMSGKAWAEFQCCAGLEKNHRHSQCTWSSSGTAPLLDSGVFLQEE